MNAESVFTATLRGTGGLSASITANNPGKVKEGQSVTLTWNSSPHAVCEGVGGTSDWAGPLAQSGSRNVTSKEAGIFDYTISCTHDAQTLPAVQAKVQIFYANVAKGALDWSVLLALMFALGLVLSSRARHERARRTAEE